MGDGKKMKIPDPRCPKNDARGTKEHFRLMIEDLRLTIGKNHGFRFPALGEA